MIGPDEECRYYTDPAKPYPYRRGALYSGVVVPFLPGQTPRALVVASGSTPERPTFTAAYPFAEAFRRASQAQRDAGIPLLVRAKLRPVVVPRVGLEEQDPIHASDVWVAPRFSEHRDRRDLPNRFPLPVCTRYGLEQDGHLDFTQVASIPRGILEQGRHVCDLSPEVLAALLAKVTQWVAGSPLGA